MGDLVLRDYQQQDVDFMVKHKRVINANEPGLGKTIEALTAAAILHTRGILILCPKIATRVWQTEAMKWYGWKSIIMTGTPKQRLEQRREFVATDTQIMITNFAQMEEISGLSTKWDTIIVDEAHLGGLLNSKTQSFKKMKKFECTNLFLLTGTPVRRGPQDLWGMLHLIDPKAFRSYWGYVNRHCHVVDNGFGKEILGRPKHPEQFKRLLSNYMVRHKKVDVLPDLPAKERIRFTVPLEGPQLTQYQQLLEDMFLETTEDFIVAPNHLVRDLHLRQLLVCPRILGIPEDGAALTSLCEYLVPEQFAVGRSVVIATPFAEAISYIVAALERSIKGIHIEIISGRIKEPAHNVAERFQQYPSHKKVLIYTIKAGASWTAHAASIGFMLGYEWSTAETVQAEDRIHRIGQRLAVQWYYLAYQDTMDSTVMEALNRKADAQGWILEPEVKRAALEALREKYKNKC